MADSTYYSIRRWVISYAPDPVSPDIFKEVGRKEELPLRTECEWCKGSYSSEKENCRNCGAPRKYEDA